MKILVGTLILLSAPPSFGQFDSTELVTLANKVKVWQAKEIACDSFIQNANKTFDKFSEERNATNAALARDSAIIANLEQQKKNCDAMEKQYLQIIESYKPSWLEGIIEHPAFGFIIGFTIAYFVLK